MDGVITVEPNVLFKEKLQLAKEKANSKLVSKLDDAKLYILKTYLKENNIEFDDSIDNLKEFVSKVVKNLDVVYKSEVEELLEKSSNEFQVLIDELKKGSTTAFRKFLTNTYSGLIKPISKGAAVSLAGRAALIMAPTLELKLAVGTGIAAHTAYKLVKNNKHKRIMDQNYECNRILQELEVTKDKERY